MLSDTATRAERTAAVMEFVRARFGGAAEAANQGLGSIKGLETAFGNFQETIGKRFAPFVEAAAKSLTRLFDFLSQNEIVGDIVAGFLAFGAALGAVAVALPLIANAFLVARAAMTAFGIASNLALGGIPLAIGLITGAIAFVAVNWGKNLALMQAALAGFTAFAKEAIGGLAQVLIGAFNLDVNQVKEGLSKITNAYKVAAKEANEAYVVEGQKADEKQDEQKKAFADKVAKRERDEQARRIALKRAEDELIQLQLQNASDQTIELKRQEIAVLKQLDTEKNVDTLALLEERRAQILQLEDQQRAEDLERKATFQAEDDEINAAINQRGIDAKAALRAQDQAELQNSLLTEREAERKVALEIAQDRIKNRNLELEDRKKYGVAVATLNSVLRTDEVQGAKAVSGELVGLAQSKNATLKAIGKAAAIAQITIATAESVVTIGQQVPRVIPFPFSIPVIAALVGARIAFSAEQIGNVRSAAQGGLVTGGTPGKDSVLVNTTPGEVIVPAPLAPTFLDLVKGGGDTGGAAADTGVANLLAGISQKLDGEFMLRIAADLFESEVFTDGVIRRISDRIEFGNATIVGVNA
ncbi:MAG: hypothetical protein BWY75_03002 [bacterium ADurb.Bin425]|nr:MAG: hypothetical protein BWY75_03002 [bacterium ADurb.Bin425]